ncbi:MAG: hypothetical protein M5U26_11595 [Planctomycetota bacterium]|nr:hypothetical protein [Planctomycetota bacterium]
MKQRIRQGTWVIVLLDEDDWGANAYAADHWFRSKEHARIGRVSRRRPGVLSEQYDITFPTGADPNGFVRGWAMSEEVYAGAERPEINMELLEACVASDDPWEFAKAHNDLDFVQRVRRARSEPDLDLRTLPKRPTAWRNP